MNVRYIVTQTAKTFVKTLIGQLPDHARFVAHGIVLPDFYDAVQRAQKGEPGEYRWRCPDPNYAWHYAVDDQGWAAGWIEARLSLMKHWGVHHVQWNPEKCDHEAWLSEAGERRE